MELRWRWGAGAALAMYCGRSAISMASPDAIMQAWPIAFSSSRTLPGQSWRASSDLRALRQAADRLLELRGEFLR